MKQNLQQSLPNAQELRIVGGTYPTPPARAAVAKACSFAFMAALALALAGPQLAIMPPFMVNFLNQQRGMVIGGGFLLNIVGNSLGQTGAYEVTLDGELIFSKLATGSVPPVEEVRRIILEKTLLEKYGNTAAAASTGEDAE